MHYHHTKLPLVSPQHHPLHGSIGVRIGPSYVGLLSHGKIMELLKLTPQE